MNFIFNFFKKNKQDYIGLSSFKNKEERKPEIRKTVNQQPEKTPLTGLLRKTVN